MFDAIETFLRDASDFDLNLLLKHHRIVERVETVDQAVVMPEAPSSIGDAAWVAEATGLSTRTIVRMARQKQIPCLHRASRVKGCPYGFRKTDVLDWLAPKR